MGSEKFDKATAADKYTVTNVANRYSPNRYRNYHHPVPVDSNHKHISDWITLEAGQFYPVESTHMEWTGSHDHHTVSVEFEKKGDFKHHHKSKEVQLLEIDTGMDYETFNITSVSPMGGKFQIMFVNPKYDKDVKGSLRTITSREVKDNDSATNIRWAVQDFYGRWDTWGTWVDVKKYETNDKFETVDSDSTQIVYTVKVMRAIDQKGFTSATILKAKTTTSTITISE